MIHFILNEMEEIFWHHDSPSNRPYSYSHGRTGNKHETEADAGKPFQMQMLFPHMSLHRMLVPVRP